MKRLIISLILCFILTLTTGRAQAVPLQVYFTGSISNVPSQLASGFTVGDFASGSFYIDSNTSDSNSDPAIGLYIGPVDFSFQFGSYSATAIGGGSGDSVMVLNDWSGQDRYAANGLGPTGGDINGYFLTNLVLNLVDNTETVFSDDSLPTSLNIADFNYAQAQMIFQNLRLPSESVLAALTSITITPITPIPEPTTMLLLGSGIIGLAGLRRKLIKM